MIGAVLRGRYELTGLLTEGPVFVAYNAKDRITGRDVTVRMVKEPFAHEPEFLNLLDKVAARYANVRSPYIESITAVDHDEEDAFMVGDLTRAPSLSDRIRKLAPFSIPVSVSTAMSLCRALDVSHRAGIIHGDLGSHNVSVLADGEVRLQMAGVWEAYSGSVSAGAVVLPSMAPYLAPEVSEGANPGVGSDIYAVGVLLYELLSGRQPYFAETPLATVLRHRSQPTPSVRDLNPSVPAVLDEIVKKAMSKDPRERYGSAAEMLTDLRMLQDALRFGRSLTWPLRQGTPGAVPTVRPAQSVAPRMSAIRDEEDPRDAKPERDVPVWVLMILVALVAVAASMVGIWFLLSMNRPRNVKVPNIRGLTVVEARSLTEKMHLKLQIGNRVQSERVEPDRIVNIHPDASTRVMEGSTLTVDVSAGGKLVDVPDLLGTTPDKARSLLDKSNMKLDTSIGSYPTANLAQGLVSRQTPVAGTKVDRGTQVHVDINGPNTPNTTAPASVSNPPNAHPKAYKYQVDINVGELPGPTRVRVEMEDQGSRVIIYDQTCNPGDSFVAQGIGHGTSATFRVYYNDETTPRTSLTRSASQATPQG